MDGLVAKVARLKDAVRVQAAAASADEAADTAVGAEMVMDVDAAVDAAINAHPRCLGYDPHKLLATAAAVSKALGPGAGPGAGAGALEVATRAPRLLTLGDREVMARLARLRRYRSPA
jgi:hypothetical protein